MRRMLPAAGLILLLGGCGHEAATFEDYQARLVTFPNGKQVRAESMLTDADRSRGMMFRDSIAPDRGMLFFHTALGKYKYWMYQTRIPLDIIWMDRDRRIVEISADTPPCTTEAGECPNYGGNYEALYVLELGGGMAAKYGLKVGDSLRF
ncbi:MAG: DUF192 domain-containing protein [Bryobacteraceae bacterium]|jgi:uncharacterized membrane protein (UPF0127 family)